MLSQQYRFLHNSKTNLYLLLSYLYVRGHEAGVFMANHLDSNNSRDWCWLCDEEYPCRHNGRHTDMGSRTYFYLYQLFSNVYLPIPTLVPAHLSKNHQEFPAFAHIYTSHNISPISANIFSPLKASSESPHPPPIYALPHSLVMDGVSSASAVVGIVSLGISVYQGIATIPTSGMLGRTY